MNVNLDLLRTSKTTALTKSYLAEAALQLLHEQDKAIAAAVAAEREAILKEADALEFKPSKWSDLLAAIRSRGGQH